MGIESDVENVKEEVTAVKEEVAAVKDEVKDAVKDDIGKVEEKIEEVKDEIRSKADESPNDDVRFAELNAQMIALQGQMAILIEAQKITEPVGEPDEVLIEPPVPVIEEEKTEEE